MNNDDFYAFRPRELVGPAVLTLALLAVVLAVQAALPVVHVHLVAAGGPLAAVSAAAFALAGGLMLRLALQDVGPERRGLFTLFGAGAVVVGLEQIGFGVSPGRVVTASSFEPSSPIHRLAIHVIAAWTLVSMLLLIARRRIAAPVLSSGVPFFAWRIMPLTLPPIVLFSSDVVTHPDGIGRLALALLVVVWSIDLYRRTTLWPLTGIESLIRRRAGLIAAAIAGAAALSSGPSPDLSGELNRVAARGYPHLGMDRQARALFAYILERPDYVDESTFANLRALYPDLAHRVVRGRVQPAGAEQRPAGRMKGSPAARALLDLAT